MKLNRYSMIILSMVLIGCAIPYPYTKSESRALNIANAGGIDDSDLHDSKDGMKSYGTSFLMQVLNFASLATSFQGSAIGLGGGATFLANSANILAEPENPSARPSFLAWVPQSTAEDKFKARDHIVDAVQTALNKTSADMQVTIEKYPQEKDDVVINKIPFDYWRVIAPELGCKKGDCLVAVYIKNPYEVTSPEILQGTIGQKCYELSATGRKDYSRVIFYQHGEKTFPEQDFYLALSRNLPAWSALYFPPNRIHQKGQPLNYPVVFEKGEMLLFKRPNN